MSSLIGWHDFEKLDIRVGTIIDAQKFPEARKPAYTMEIDFGEEVGIKKSSAQITELYQVYQIIGQKVIAVVNMEPKRIGSFTSECLVLGIYTEDGVSLLRPDKFASNGDKIG